jgi:ABC-type multidrug transport system fused ATPase/permease subunit
MNLDSRGPTTNCESENDGLGLRGVGVGDGGDINIVSSSHPAPSPQSRRESLLDGLISTSRRSFATMERSMDTVGSIDTTETGKSSSPGGGGGGARTGINLEQIEEVDIEDSIRPTPISTVPIPPYTPIFGAEGRRMPSAGTAVTGGTTTVESRRSIFITETIAGRYNEEQLNEKLVQVNIKNFSYFIPEKMDRPSVPTVFNQSVFYATFEVGRRVTKYVQSKIGEKKSNHGRTTVNPPEQHTNTAGGDDIDAVEVVGEVVDPSSMSWTPTTAQDIVYPYSKRPVLKDVNLVLKPGNTYLVLGPPGCGKTSLLKAVANRLRYAGNSEDECLPNQPHLEGRIEYNGVATTVRCRLTRILHLFWSTPVPA